MPASLHWLNPWCSHLTDRPRSAHARPDRVRSIWMISGSLGIAPSDALASLSWLTPSPPGTPHPVPRSEVEEMLRAVRMLLCRGAMHLWLSQRARLQNWWTRSASEGRTHSLLMSDARHTLAKKARELDRHRLRSRQVELKKWGGVAHPDSWSCFRESSNRLRALTDAAPRYVESETPLELAEWMAGIRNRTETRVRIPRF